MKGMDRTMKKFFIATKFLWFGAIMGALQQLLGELDSILYQGHDIFSFSAIMDCLSLYAAIILLVIRRDVPPKHQLKDLFLFFVGLDLFYYLYIFIIELITFISNKLSTVDPMLDTGMPFSKTVHEIGDFIKWTTIGLAAAVWAYVATKLRNLDKKVFYIIMLLPLFAVMIVLFIGDTYTTTMFFVTGGKSTAVSGLQNYYHAYPCELSGALTSLTALILCLYKFLKKPAKNKNQTQEA